MRQDRQPLTKEAIETLWMYASFILDLYGEGEGTPVRELTPGGFRRFCIQYKEDMLLNDHARFKNMPIPL